MGRYYLIHPKYVSNAVLSNKYMCKSRERPQLRKNEWHWERLGRLAP